MTLRSILVGLLLGAAICAVSYFNDSVIRQTRMVASYMPVSLFGIVIMLAMLANPMLAYARRRWAFSGRELAVVLAILLVAGTIPSMGLMHYFTNVCMMPHQLETTRITWKKHRVLELIPSQMLADVGGEKEAALTDFLKGKGQQNEHIGFSDIPWEAWKRTLSFWLPVLVSIFLALMGLALVLHQQWSAHERLRYPIATFAASLMPDRGHVLSGVFRQRSFWVGLLAVLGIHMANYLHAWWPGTMIHIPLYIDFRPLTKLWEVFRAGMPGDALMAPRLYFTAMGFAFFLATDLSLSLGLAPLLFTITIGTLVTTGVAVEDRHMTANIIEFMYAGAWAGMGLVLLYVGRRYYASTFRKALFLPGGDPVKPFSVWGARTFLVGAAMFVFLLARVGLDWPLAILYTFAVTMMFVIISRIVAETGVYFLHPWHFPGVTLFGFLGIEAIGPQNYLIMLLVTTVILMNPRASLMPFVVQGLKIVDLKGAKPGPTVAVGAVALLIALAIAVPVTLYWQYDRGVYEASDGWARDWAPKFAINAFLNMKDKYEVAQGRPLTDTVSGLARFGKIRPDKRLMLAFGIMLALVLLFSAARMRFPWWPLHPMLFIVLGTWQTKVLAFSFLAGWFVKVAVTGLGGQRAYQRTKPLMIGLIAGEILAAVVPMIVGGVYYLITGLPPVPFGVV